MQRLRALVPATRLRLAVRNQTGRVFSAQPSYSLYDDSEKEVILILIDIDVLLILVVLVRGI